MKKWIALSLLLLVGLALLAACGQSTTSVAEVGGRRVAVDGGAYRQMTASQLQAMLEAKDFVLVNVHIPFAGNIPGTDLAIPFNEVSRRADLLPKDKQAKIIVYCRSGAMSAVAARTLVAMGYTNVWDLAGGMNAWQRAGFSLEQDRP